PCRRFPYVLCGALETLPLLLPLFRHPYYLLLFNDPSTPELYTLSLHDALPILPTSTPAFTSAWRKDSRISGVTWRCVSPSARRSDRKSTRLNSSHVKISYAVFCLKKKKKAQKNPYRGRNRKGLAKIRRRPAVNV